MYRLIHIIGQDHHPFYMVPHQHYGSIPSPSTDRNEIERNKEKKRRRSQDIDNEQVNNAEPSDDINVQNKLFQNVEMMDMRMI